MPRRRVSFLGVSWTPLLLILVLGSLRVVPQASAYRWRASLSPPPPPPPPSSILTTARSVSGGASDEPPSSAAPDASSASQDASSASQDASSTVNPPADPATASNDAPVDAVLQSNNNNKDAPLPPPPPPAGHPKTTTFMNTPHRDQQRASWKRHFGVVQQQLRAKTVQVPTMLARTQTWAAATLQQARDKHAPSRLLTTLSPPFLAALFANKEASLSFFSVYCWALAGSSVGFYLFLYFISIGYAAGITLPLVACLAKYWRTVPAASRSADAACHTAAVILWGCRSVAFFLYREYAQWPELHKKIVQANNQKQAPTVAVKLLCWLVYSFLYVCMLSPCWLRLQSAAASSATATAAVSNHHAAGTIWWSRTSLALQLAGLALETVADWQKSAFKTSNLPDSRHEWCRTGVWSWGTHPNYAGEWLFWLGTVAGGLPAICYQQQHTFALLLLVLTGFVFITTVLRGAVTALDGKHWEKYGGLVEFREFRARYTVLGPKLVPLVQEWWRHSSTSNQAFLPSTADTRAEPALTELSLDGADGAAPPASS